MKYPLFGLELIYNVYLDLAAIIFLVVIASYLWMQYSDKGDSTKQFKRLLIWIIVCNVLDVFSAIEMSYIERFPYWVSYVSYSAFLLSLAGALLQYLKYIRSFLKKEESGNVGGTVNLIVSIIYALFIISNCFTGLLFSFEDNRYVEGPIYILVCVYASYMILNGLILGIIHYRQLNKRQFFAIVSFTVVEIAGSLIQFLIIPHVLLSTFAASVVVIALVFSLETPDYKRLEIAMEQLRASSDMLAKAKQEAEEAREYADAANQAKSAFLASMSHEIRTPINGVLGMNSIIMKESKDEKILEYARNIDNAGNGLLSLINDILDFSKIESGKMEIVPVEYELSNVLSACYNMVFLRAENKGLELLFENNMTIPNRLFGDEVRIRQIIVNLLTNAIKYTEEGMVLLTADWEEGEDNAMTLVVSVKDTGIGIKKKNIDKLFDAFQRVDESRNRNIEGTGLGLKITKQFLDLMGGTISVESVYGKGSEFVVRIPQKIITISEELGDFAHYVHISTNKETAPNNRFKCPKGSVLVVDDVEMNNKVIVGLLKDTELNVDTASSGYECLEKIQLHTYDVILLDHMMPHMDGIETLKEMKKLGNVFNPNIPVIMLTANAVSGAREEYLELGFTDYLSKPVREQELNAMLLKYLPQELVKVEKVADGNSEPESAVNHEAKTEEVKQELSSFEKRFSFLDIRTGMTYCLESEEFYESVIREFRNSSKYEEIQACYDDANLKDYAILVHAVKSSSLTIGAVEVSNIAKALEAAAKSEDIDFLREHHYDFMRKYGELLDRLDEVYGGY